MNTLTIVCLSILYLIFGACSAIYQDRRSHRSLSTDMIVLETLLWPALLGVYGLGYVCKQYAQFVYWVNRGK